ncbi:hypothetical protein [Streptomyces sp. NPDC002889]|uniref:hypothetical protein n=1 Tax=Streptomyces sp. NPDC002889 TaxID=3364669 RepID=UPI003687FE5F
MLVTAAAPFYESGTFWAAAAVFATLGVGVGAMWATLRANNPKRRLAYWMGSTRLVASDHLDSLEIRRHGTFLSEPRVVRVQLVNTGRRDISSAAFDRDLPIVMDLGIPILELLGTESHPPISAAPEAAAQGTTLRIGPGRLGRKESVTYLVLVDGRPEYSCQHTLVDVDVKETDDLLFPAPPFWGRLFFGLPLALAAASAGAWLFKTL